ncbi:biotin synthase BioB [Arhodomonas aquaeolei]|uniref:biotin synthase BioB n=2 Tax=Arhodomonas TaxID=2368 RepID=UPI00037D7F56|nr:biotin synthase BioB [Arhodomonas aquaeolei]
MSVPATGDIRHDWSADEVRALFDAPFTELLFAAQQVHRRYFDPAQVELASLVSVKTGACPEDCAYCPQSVRFQTDVEPHALMPVASVREAARRAREAGVARLCLGAAWRGPKARDMPRLREMIAAVREQGLEVCLSAGLLSDGQARELADAGLDYYNHNLDTSPEYYPEIITTRRYDERLSTLAHVRDAGLRVCCGGIVGLGEGETDRAELLRTLANLPAHPESVPINQLIPVPGTPMAEAGPPDELAIVRTIAVARILMPRARVRLSAGRTQMSDAVQALCVLAGANSLFFGDVLLTAENPDETADRALLARLGLEVEAPQREPALAGGEG